MSAGAAAHAQAVPGAQASTGAALRYRRATADDAQDCIELRGRTRENAVSVDRLRSIGITAASWGEEVRSGALPGHVCLSEGRIVGYGFGARDTGEVVVLALLPEVEGRGIGAELLGRVVAELVQRGHRRLFLGCSADPKSRSFGFYRHLGWRSTGSFDAHGDELLEFFPLGAGHSGPA